MTVHKSTASHPVNLPGGRVLAAGESGDADPTDPLVVDLVADGQLTPVVAPAARKTSHKES